VLLIHNKGIIADLLPLDQLIQQFYTHQFLVFVCEENALLVAGIFVAVSLSAGKLCHQATLNSSFLWSYAFFL